MQAEPLPMRFFRKINNLSVDLGPKSRGCVKVWSVGVLEYWSDKEIETFEASNTPQLHYSKIIFAAKPP
jgi:hypothetical protein